MKRSNIYVIVAVVAAALAVAALALVPTGPREYTVRMREYSFKLEDGDFPLRVKAGEAFRIKLINEGAVTHELMLVKDKDEMLMMAEEIIEELKAEGLEDMPQEMLEAYEEEHEKLMEENPDMILGMWDLDIGKDTVIDLKIDTPGTYWAICQEIEGTLPEIHQHRGMFAEIIVEG